MSSYHSVVPQILNKARTQNQPREVRDEWKVAFQNTALFDDLEWCLFHDIFITTTETINNFPSGSTDWEDYASEKLVWSYWFGVTDTFPGIAPPCNDSKLPTSKPGKILSLPNPLYENLRDQMSGVITRKKQGISSIGSVLAGPAPPINHEEFTFEALSKVALIEARDVDQSRRLFSKYEDRMKRFVEAVNDGEDSDDDDSGEESLWMYAIN